MGCCYIDLKKVHRVQKLITLVLKDKLHITWIPSQRHSTKWACGLESRGAAWYGNICPIFDTLFARHVTTRYKAIVRGKTVNIKSCKYNRITYFASIQIEAKKLYYYLISLYFHSLFYLALLPCIVAQLLMHLDTLDKFWCPWHHLDFPNYVYPDKKWF